MIDQKSLLDMADNAAADDNRPVVRAIQPEIKETPFKAYSVDGDVFDADNMVEVFNRLQNAGLLVAGTRFYSANATHPDPASFLTAEIALDAAQDRADGEYGEYADDLTDGVTDEAKAELDAFLEVWSRKNLSVRAYNLSNKVEHTITVAMIDCWDNRNSSLLSHSDDELHAMLYPLILKAYCVDDEGTIYAAISQQEAIELYAADSSEPIDLDSPDAYLLSDDQLDEPQRKTDTNGNTVAGQSSIREWLAERTVSGWLAGSE